MLDLSGVNLSLKLFDDRPWAGQMSCTSQRIELLPGPHTLHFTYVLTGWMDTGSDSASISFIAEAERNYRLMVRRRDRDEYRCTLTEVETARVIVDKRCEQEPAMRRVWEHQKRRFEDCGISSLYNVAGTRYGYELGEDIKDSIFLQWLAAEGDAGLWLGVARSNGYPIPEGAYDYYGGREIRLFEKAECRLETAR